MLHSAIYKRIILYKPLQINYKAILCLVLVGAAAACKNNNVSPSSDSITGNWKFAQSYYITIAGEFHTTADVSKPVIINFSGSNYIETTGGKVTESGTYTLLDKYEYTPGYYVYNVLKVDTLIKGKYKIYKGSPDTLRIESIVNGPDVGRGVEYLREK